MVNAEFKSRPSESRTHVFTPHEPASLVAEFGSWWWVLSVVAHCLLLRLGPAPHAAIFHFFAPVSTCKLSPFSFPSGADNPPLSHPPLPNLAKCRVPASEAPFSFIDSEDIFVSSLWFKDFTVITMETQSKRKTCPKKRQFPETYSIFEFWFLSSHSSSPML